MKKTLRGKLSYSNVVATFALFLVLAGGTAYAASISEKTPSSRKTSRPVR